MPALPKWILVALALAATVVVVTSVVLVTKVALDGPSSRTLSLDGVSTEDLARNGITLYAPPPNSSPDVTVAEAMAAISNARPDARVKQIVLAQVVDTTGGPLSKRLLWVANLAVSGNPMGLHGGPASSPFTTYVYDLLFVDPTTGGVLGDVSLGAPLPAQ